MNMLEMRKQRLTFHSIEADRKSKMGHTDRAIHEKLVAEILAAREKDGVVPTPQSTKVSDGPQEDVVGYFGAQTMELAAERAFAWVLEE